MPMYDYRCVNDDCDYIEESVLIRSRTSEDSEKPVCSECGSEMERLVNGSYRIFYNSDGFHRTDYTGKNSQ